LGKEIKLVCRYTNLHAKNVDGLENFCYPPPNGKGLNAPIVEIQTWKSLSRHFRQKAPCQVNRYLAEKALVVVASTATPINYRFNK